MIRLHRWQPPAGEKEQVAPEILIPAFVDPDGRDSLGRGLDEASIAVAVAADRAVQREREALPHYLAGAYRDPHAAKARLDEMVKRQGRTSTAARIARDPTQLGELRGKVGFFAGSKAKAERAMAERAAGAVAPSLERIGAAEARAAQTIVRAWRRSARPTPRRFRNSPRGRRRPWRRWRRPRMKRLRAELWRGITADQTIGPELRRFSAAVQQRFGDDTVRAMLRSRGGPVEAASVPRAHQAAARHRQPDRPHTPARRARGRRRTSHATPDTRTPGADEALSATTTGHRSGQTLSGHYDGNSP